MALDPRKLIAELRSVTCRCGAAKKTRQTFCPQCYYALPHSMRVRLWDLMGEGYEQAYAAAAEKLGMDTSDLVIG